MLCGLIPKMSEGGLAPVHLGGGGMPRLMALLHAAASTTEALLQEGAELHVGASGATLSGPGNAVPRTLGLWSSLAQQPSHAPPAPFTLRTTQGIGGRRGEIVDLSCSVNQSFSK